MSSCVHSYLKTFMSDLFAQRFITDAIKKDCNPIKIAHFETQLIENVCSTLFVDYLHNRNNVNVRMGGKNTK